MIFLIVYFIFYSHLVTIKTKYILFNCLKFIQGCLSTWKNLKFLTILLCSVVKFRFGTKSLLYKPNFNCHHLKFFFEKTH